MFAEAPDLLTTTIGCPRLFAIAGEIMRATVSRMPPGATGTTSVTVLLGNPWAWAYPASSNSPPYKSACAAFFIGVSSLVESLHERSRHPLRLRLRHRGRRRQDRT